MPKLCKIIDKCSSVKHVIFMNNSIFEGSGGKKAKDLLLTFENVVPEHVTLHEMATVEDYGAVIAAGDDDFLDEDEYKPSRDSVAMIMYTSGSTGNHCSIVMTIQ